MTNEEARLTIDYLKSIQEGCVDGEGFDMHPLPEWYALDKAIDLILQTRWVPVSERLPNPGETEGNVVKYYLVQTEYGDRLVACYDNDRWQQIFHYDYEIKEKIVAWMPLPKRYEPKEG